VAVAGALDGIATAESLREESDHALLALERIPELGPAADLAELGAWPQVARLWSASGRPEMPSLLAPIQAHRSGPLLAEALEAVLDAGGDAGGAAARIHVHRSTLYRRLEATEELTGLSLESGENRLRLHLALRMARLAQG
jgi:hypothetical protein